MKKEWFLDRYCGRQFVALVEDGKVVEFEVEKEELGCIVGNIYKGRVMNVLAGMNAAFIDCGLERNCYLSMDEAYTDCTKYDGTAGVSAAAEFQEGDEIIVQVTKPQRGTKGAKVTTHLSFVGKRVIYLPNTDFLGVSRKIADETTREQMLQTAKRLRGEEKGSGFILRTQAPSAKEEELLQEAAYLRKLYGAMLHRVEDAPVGAVLYQDEDLPARVVRDSFGDEIVMMHVGDRELYERLLDFARLHGDLPESKLSFFDGPRSMFREYGISQLVYEATKPRVPLEVGGSLVIDHTEAMTVIDVNSGSFIGDHNLEDTVFALNLCATEEIARQVRLRNISGIVVVDFIDMADEAHRQDVTKKLEEYLQKDKAKCHVLPMSELCITQFTRKRVGNTLSSHLIKPCPHCHGNGSVHDDLFMHMQIRDELLDCFTKGYTCAVVDLNEGMARKVLEDAVYFQESQGRWKNKKIYLVPHKTYKEHCFHVRGEKDTPKNLPEKAILLY